MENLTEENENSTFGDTKPIKPFEQCVKNDSVLLRWDCARDTGNGKEQNGAEEWELLSWKEKKKKRKQDSRRQWVASKYNPSFVILHPHGPGITSQKVKTLTLSS